MRVVNIKELKARLSAYVREATRGEVFLVTDRNRVVARLAPADEPDPRDTKSHGMMARLLALGARPPLRDRRAADYQRAAAKISIDTRQIDALLHAVREEGDAGS